MEWIMPCNCEIYKEMVDVLEEGLIDVIVEKEVTDLLKYILVIFLIFKSLSMCRIFRFIYFYIDQS